MKIWQMDNLSPNERNRRRRIVTEKKWRLTKMRTLLHHINV
jgi:hypothetical protein